jgi:hypothetical protein
MQQLIPGERFSQAILRAFGHEPGLPRFDSSIALLRQSYIKNTTIIAPLPHFGKRAGATGHMAIDLARAKDLHGAPGARHKRRV